MITVKDCDNVAKKFTTKTDFHNKARRYYDAAKKLGVFEEITKHMECSTPSSLYTLKEVVEQIGHYKYKRQFIKENPQMANWINNHKHHYLYEGMEIDGNQRKRCVYVYEFSDKVCYVGLTFSINERDKQHRNSDSSQVYKYSLLNNEPIPFPKKLTDYIEAEDASLKEREFCEKYANEGWCLLNIAKAGGLGTPSSVKYTKDYCRRIAQQYKTKRELELANRYVYMKIKRMAWDKDLFSHMDPVYAEQIRRQKISASKTGKKIRITDKERFFKSHSQHPILQKNLEGKILNEYMSANDAARKNNCSPTTIRIYCDTGKVGKGFLWEWKEEYPKKIYNTQKSRGGNYKKVEQYTLEGIFLKKFETIKEAASFDGKNHSTIQISKCCRGKIKNAFGFIWKFGT